MFCLVRASQQNLKNPQNSNSNSFGVQGMSTFPQIQKSSSHGLLVKGCHAAHKTVIVGEDGPQLSVNIERVIQNTGIATSCSLMTFTEAACFKHVSGDLRQVADGKVQGRVRVGCLVNLDEETLQMLRVRLTA